MRYKDTISNIRNTFKGKAEEGIDASKRGVGHLRKGDLKRRYYHRKTTTTGEEPLLDMLDAIMTKQGVSDDRLTTALGWSHDRIKNWRNGRRKLSQVAALRKAFAALGYELRPYQIAAAPISSTLVTDRMDWLGLTKRRRRKPLNKSQLWANLEYDFDKAEEETESLYRKWDGDDNT